MSEPKKGIDVSEWNGIIDWSRVKQEGIEYVWIRSSYGASKTLNVLEDKKFRYNASGALANGFITAPYHFATLNSHQVVEDATKEAEFFLNLLTNFVFSGRPVLDLESNKFELSPEEVYLWVDTFRNYIQSKVSYRLLLYSYTPFLKMHLPKGIDMPLWLAQYPNGNPTQPSMPPAWKKEDLFAWQYSAKGKVNGITTDVDLNKIYQ